MKHLLKIINIKATRVKSYRATQTAGVSYCKSRGSYRARLITGGRSIHVGYFKERWDAICSKQAFMNKVEVAR